MASVPHVPVDTFAELNDGDTDAIRDLVAAATPMLMPTELIGMGLGGAGVLNADMAALRSSFDPNSPPAGATAAASGLPPTLTGGSSITGADDGIDASPDMAPAPDGWVMKTLFRDWGDTAGSGDGGFETAAIVVKNLGPGTSHPFDRMLMNRYANDSIRSWFTLNAEGAVSLMATDHAAAIGNIRVSVEGSQAAALRLMMNMNDQYVGTYFGSPVLVQCAGDGCSISRSSTGTTSFQVTDNVPATPGFQPAPNSNWLITPLPGAMITVPDQDWMAYGAWMTTPDDAAGTHRIGTFFNGMDLYTNTAAIMDGDDGLEGSATYSGGAAGIYVDGADSGLFTAEATLTANFNVAGEDDDYMLSGQINNFRGTDGRYLGSDTAAMPNDPIAGGENDWVVILPATTLAVGVITGTPSKGSADGVPWTGTWSAQLFGPNTVMGDAAAPTGVAGQFRSATATDMDDDTTPVTAVVGAFGAERQAPAAN